MDNFELSSDVSEFNFNVLHCIGDSDSGIIITGHQYEDLSPSFSDLLDQEDGKLS